MITGYSGGGGYGNNMGGYGGNNGGPGVGGTGVNSGGGGAGSGVQIDDIPITNFVLRYDFTYWSKPQNQYID